ncbi:hypothetical protein TNCV_3744911 [Trichonephila clavipes]|nr:hypothetical protein TNCV_3744911 [Trichonephila clavipes]
MDSTHLLHQEWADFFRVRATPNFSRCCGHPGCNGEYLGSRGLRYTTGSTQWRRCLQEVGLPYLLVHGRYFISLLPPIGSQWRRSPIRHLGSRPLGFTGSPEGLFPSRAAAQQKKILYPAMDTRTCQH